jgi:hypothetical protein
MAEQLFSDLTMLSAGVLPDTRGASAIVSMGMPVIPDPPPIDPAFVTQVEKLKTARFTGFQPEVIAQLADTERIHDASGELLMLTFDGVVSLQNQVSSSCGATGNSRARAKQSGLAARGCFLHNPHRESPVEHDRNRQLRWLTKLRPAVRLRAFVGGLRVTQQKPTGAKLESRNRL